MVGSAVGIVEGAGVGDLEATVAIGTQAPAEIFSQNGVGRQAKLIDIFASSVGTDAVLGAARRSGRLMLPEGPRPRAENPFSSCHLPGVIELFYKELKGVAAPPS